MQHAVDMNRLHRGALQRRQQNAAQRISQRHAKAPLQRLGDHGRLALGIGAGASPAACSVGSVPASSSEWSRWHPSHCAARRRAAHPTPPRGNFGGGGLLWSPPDKDIVCHTLRLLRGRQPLWGIGVTSRMEVMVNPADCSERSANSRPSPGLPPPLRECACRAPGPSWRRPRPRPAPHRASIFAIP